MSDPCVFRMIWGNKTALHGCPHPSNPSRITFKDQKLCLCLPLTCAGLQVQQVTSSDLKTWCCCPLFFNQSCILKQWNQMESSQLKINIAGRRVKCWKWCADAQLALDFLKRQESEDVWMCVFYRTWHLPDLNNLLISGKDVQRGCWEIVLTEVKLKGGYIALVTLQHGWKLLGMASK